MLQVDNIRVEKKRLLHFENGVQTWLVSSKTLLQAILKVSTDNDSRLSIQKELWCIKHLVPDDYSIDILAFDTLVKETGDNGNCCFVRKYFPTSLNQTLTNTDAMTLQAAGKIISQLIEQLVLLHAKGFLNLDVKPDNVLLTEEGRAVLSDFGSCIAYTKEAKALVGSLPFWSQQVFSTSKYMHPDIVSHKENIGPWADVYALGMLVEEIATKLPANQSARLQDIILLCKQVTPQVSSDVLSTCMKMMNKTLDEYEQNSTRLFEADVITEDNDNETAPEYVTKHHQSHIYLPRVGMRNAIVGLFILVGAILMTAWLMQGNTESKSTPIAVEDSTHTVSSSAADKQTVFRHVDEPNAPTPEVGIDVSDQTYMRELRYQTQSGQWAKLPFVKQTINGKAIWVSIYEVNNRLYDACVGAGKCSSNTIFSTRESRKRLNLPAMPTVNLSWVMINQEFLPFARQQFGLVMRLPTLQEWQALSVSTRNSIDDGVYSMHCKNCGFTNVGEDGGAMSVDAIAPDVNGLVHIYGNVREWLDGCAYDNAGIERCYQAFVAGGSWRDDYQGIMNNPIDVLQKRARSIDTGFRLVFDD